MLQLITVETRDLNMTFKQTRVHTTAAIYLYRGFHKLDEIDNIGIRGFKERSHVTKFSPIFYFKIKGRYFKLKNRTKFCYV